MKLYAKQVPPERQESPLFFGDWPENVYVFGNRHYNSHAERLEGLARNLEQIAETFEDVRAGYLPNENLHAVLWYHLPRDDGRGYTRAERLELVRLAQDYCETGDDGALCGALELITGREWECTTIYGCCQGDWQNIIFPAEYGRDWLNAFEAEYFNTGEEWIIDPDGDAYSVYITSWRDDDKRRDIADAAGVDPEDIVLLAFSGWSQMARYTEVTA